MVLRGGYGIFYQQTDRYGSESQLGLNLPQLVDASITANSARRCAGLHLRAGLHAARRRDREPGDRAVAHPGSRTRTRRSCSSSASAPNSSSPTTWWRRSNTSATARATAGGCATSTRASSPATARWSFPYAQYGYGNAYLEQIVTNGRADYDALQMRMQRRMSGGLALHGGLHLEQGARRLPRSPERRRRRDRQHPADRPTTWSRTTARCAFDIPHRLVTSFIYELPFGAGRDVRAGRRARRDRARLVGQRHPDAERRPAVHGDRRPTGRHGPGTHRARQLRRRRGAGRLRPDARFVVRSDGVRADDGADLRQLRATTPCAGRARSR